MTTKDKFGQKVRGYEVIVARPKEKYNLRYPAKDCPLLTGMESIEIMEKLAKRGFICAARTETQGTIEELTLDEMKDIVI